MKHTPDFSGATWRKSSYSDGGANNCVEVGVGHPAAVPVRDSKLTDGPVIVFGAASWSSFLTSACENPGCSAR